MVVHVQVYIFLLQPLVKITVQRDSLITLSDSEFRSLQQSFQPEVKSMLHFLMFGILYMHMCAHVCAHMHACMRACVCMYVCVHVCT